MGGIQVHKIVTQIPGPKSAEMAQELDAVFDARAVHFVVDYDNSEDN
jgi:4-aminobutyrate aminotransferase/(S)-3-amino-2-methylpropionate transaminase